MVPGFTLADFQRLPLPAGTANVQPSNGYTLVNVPTNVYAEAAATTLDTQLLGFPVQVRATPTRYEWDFGDGGSSTETNPSHTYRELAIGLVTLTVTDNDGGEQALPGTTTTSAARVLGAVVTAAPDAAPAEPVPVEVPETTTR